MTKTILTMCLLSFVSLGGCGNDRGDDDGDSACEAAGHGICDRACACRDGDGCGVTDSTGGGLTLGFDDLAGCEAFYVTLACSGGGDETIDLDACASDVPDAECAGTGEDAAVAVPASCESQE